MSSDKKMALKRDKDMLMLFDGQVKDIRLQLNEQLKCLDVRLETQVSLVVELQDYFRRRAEVELEYSRSLEKLSKGLLIRHKAEKQKRDQWHLFSSYSCWQHLIATTRKQSRDHAVLSEIFANQLINRFNHIMEDVQRMYKRCREIGIESHEELLKVLHELHTSMKTYHGYHAEERQAEAKLKGIEAQRSKLEISIPKEKLEKAKKFKLIVKEIEKRESKYNDAKTKALKARNDYLLCMDASNAAVHKYFVDDLSDLIDCMDFGFHTCLARTLMMHLSSEDCLRKSQQSHIDGMNKCITSLDSRVDKQKFLEFNNSAFMVPKKFEFQPHKADECTEVSAEKNIKEELEQRHKQLSKRLTALKTESEEIWKTLETAERSLLEMITAKDYDCSTLFEEETGIPKSCLKQPEGVAIKLRADRQETEDFYLNKFREYTLGSNLITRLQSKQRLMRRALGSGEEAGEDDSTSQASSSVGSSPHPALRPHNLPQKQRKKRIGRTPLLGQPKLFGGSLEEYLETTNQEIPLLILSCIRIINLYGLHHQGIFRVSGSQVEINNFRETFERGDDPLADVSDASDINSIAGVLKLYLRELREPLFPIYYFELLMETSQLESKQQFISRVKDVIANLPRSVVLVLRYLFAFLNHLSEFSDENMMDPYNLAICFGPTLLPIPEDKDQVQFQNLVNELIKNIIIYQEEIFVDEGGLSYEKYISTNVPDENDVGESPPDRGSDQIDDLEAENVPSEDETDNLEAVAQFDFKARSQRELSFRRGDTLTLYTQVSNDWWKGNIDGKEGLIPDKYILLKIRDDDKDKLSTGSGATSERRRTSSSSDSLCGISPSPRIHSSTEFILEESSNGSPKCTESCPSMQNREKVAISSKNCSLPIIPDKEKTIRLRRRSLSPSIENLKPLAPPGWDVRKLRPCLSADESASCQREDVRFTEDAGGDLSGVENSLSDLNLNDLSAYDPPDEHSNSELAKDLENTLAKVYTSITTLEKEKEMERQLLHHQRIDSREELTLNVNERNATKSIVVVRPKCKDTPDLVMDLPVNPSSPTSSTSSESGGLGESPPSKNQLLLMNIEATRKEVSSDLNAAAGGTNSINYAAGGGGGSVSELTTAERFALSNQCTMKKGTMSRSKTQVVNQSSLTAGQSSLSDAQTQTFPIRRSASTNADLSPTNKVISTVSLAPLPATPSGGQLLTEHEAKRFNNNKATPPDVPEKPGKPKINVLTVENVLPLNEETIKEECLKPQVKVKPPVMKKPTNYIPSPELQRRTQEREYKQTSC